MIGTEGKGREMKTEKEMKAKQKEGKNRKIGARDRVALVKGRKRKGRNGMEEQWKSFWSPVSYFHFNREL